MKLIVLDWVSDKLGIWTKKGKILAGNCAGESGRKSSHFLARLPAGLTGEFLEFNGMATASNPARTRPDCDVAVTIHFHFDFYFFVSWLVNRLSTLTYFGTFEIVCNCLSSPGESWAGSSLTSLVRLRGKWGCHTIKYNYPKKKPKP